MERDRQARWDAGHMRTVSTKMTDKEFFDFRLVCAAEGMTPYALIQKLLREWMRERG